MTQISLVELLHGEDGHRCVVSNCQTLDTELTPVPLYEGADEIVLVCAEHAKAWRAQR